MSAAIDENAQDQGLPDVGADGSPADAVADGQAGEATLLDKVRADPDFAVEQIKKRDAQISEKSNKLKSYSAFDPYLEVGQGPDQILNLAAFGSRVQEIPGLNELVQKSIQEGRLALPEQSTAEQNDPNEDWMDEDTKRVRDEARQEIAELKQQLSELQGTANAASVRSQEVHVRRNLESALADFEKVPEAREEALAMIEGRIGIAQKQAMAGDAKQAALIDQLAGPEGEEILSFMVHQAGLLRKYGPQIYAAENTRTDQAASALGKSTDAPASLARPQSPTIERPPKGSAGTAGAMMAVLEQVRAAKGRSVS